MDSGASSSDANCSPLDTENGGPTAVVLLSGGLDSATTLAIARDAGYSCHAISFDYGQRHRVELDAARRVGQHLGAASHRCIVIDQGNFRAVAPHTDDTGQGFRGSALTEAIDVPKDRDEARMTDGIPVTYVPARNTIFLSHALALAEVLDCADIFIGVNAVDYSGYPDCRPQFIRAYEQMANLATRAAVEGRRLTIHTPLIDLTKAQIIQRGLSLGVDFAHTHSCYAPDAAGRPCRRCDACILRQRGFKEIGLTDPLLV